LIGIVIGTGPSLAKDADLVRQLKADGKVQLFGINNTFQDFDLDVWIACDPAWHKHYGRVECDFDKWHWDAAICNDYGYRYVEGVWIVDGNAYPRSEYLTPPGDAGGLWMQDKSRISLNHCSGAQLLNLACNQYACETVLLVGHDFHYDAPQRHYFDNLSETPGEYPQEIRKFSKFDKQGAGYDLLAVYKKIAEQDGLPPIINCSPGSKLPWFPMGEIKDYV